MNKILLFLLFLIGTTCQAQLKNFAIQLSGNYPIIQSVEETNQLTSGSIPSVSGFQAILLNVGKLKESYTSKVGFEIGGQFDYLIAERFFITSGLTVNYLRFQRKVRITELSQAADYLSTSPFNAGSPFGSIIYSGHPQLDTNGRLVLDPENSLLISHPDDLGSTTILSMQAPIMVGASFCKHKLQVRTGAIFSYLLQSTEVKEKFVAGTMNNRMLSPYTDKNKSDFNEFQAGATLTTTYLIGGNFGVNLTARKFFTPIYDNSRQEAGKAKYNVLSLGLEYRL
jgi:hypothetical protein